MPADRSRPTPDDFLPVKPVELLVLSALADGEAHGYRIRQRILERTGGTIELEAANLYRNIRGLDADGLIEECDAPADHDHADERRRYLRLTPLGRRVLAAELSRLRDLVRWAERRHVIAPESGR